MRLLVVSDTHLTAARLERMPAPVREAAEGADAVLHAGDIVERAVLDDLARYAPVHAVCGNNDRSLVGTLPERLEVELAGVRIGMVHDSGPRQGRRARLQEWFPDCAVIVFGHSHIPVLEEGDPLLLNPGSPTQRRRQPHATFALVELSDGSLEDARHVEIPPS